MTKCRFCEDCEYCDECVDYENFWGDSSVGRTTVECDYGFDPDDPDCPRHDDWVEECAEEDAEEYGDEEEEEDEDHDD